MPQDLLHKDRVHPPAYFHVTGPDIDATFRVEDGSFIRGKIPKRVSDLVQRFFGLHKKKVIAVWNNTRPDGWPVGYVLPNSELESRV